MMRRIFTLCILFFFAKGIYAQNGFWFSDYQQALNYSFSKKVPLLLIFSGSDWCRPCIILKNEILSDSAFRAFAESNLAVAYIDFPRMKKNRLSPEQTAKNERVAERYNPEGAFPKILLVGNNEKVYKQIVFRYQDVDNFISDCGIEK